MKSFLGLLLSFAAVLALLLGMAVGVGLLLQWIMPSVETGSAILVGLVSIITTVYVLARVFQFAARLESLVPSPDDDLDRDEEDDEDDEEEADYDAPRGSSPRRSPLRIRRRRKRRN